MNANLYKFNLMFWKTKAIPDIWLKCSLGDMIEWNFAIAYESTFKSTIYFVEISLNKGQWDLKLFPDNFKAVKSFHLNCLLREIVKKGCPKKGRIYDQGYISLFHNQQSELGMWLKNYFKYFFQKHFLNQQANVCWLAVVALQLFFLFCWYIELPPR